MGFYTTKMTNMAFRRLVAFFSQLSTDTVIIYMHKQNIFEIQLICYLKDIYQIMCFGDPYCALQFFFQKIVIYIFDKQKYIQLINKGRKFQKLVSQHWHFR